jgi:hypothetical protein
MERPENPLDIVGGFEAYQDRIYETIMGKVKSWTVEQLLKYEQHVVDRNRSHRKDGLKDGLIGLIQSKRYLTRDNIELLEPGLGFYRSTLFKEKIEKYLTEPNPTGKETPILAIEDKGLHRRTGEYVSLVHAISEASDEVIANKVKRID